MSWSEGGWVLPLAGIVITIPAAIGYHVGRLYHPPTTFLTMSVGGIVGVAVLAHILSSLTEEGGVDSDD